MTCTTDFNPSSKNLQLSLTLDSNDVTRIKNCGN